MLKTFSNTIIKVSLAITMLVGGAITTGSVGFLGGSAVYATNTECSEDATYQPGQAIDPDAVVCGDTKTIVDKMFGFAQIIAGIVLGVAVIMIAYAGFKYVTSQGDPKATEQAKMQVVAAGVGIGIAMLAFVILNVFKGLF